MPDGQRRRHRLRVAPRARAARPAAPGLYRHALGALEGTAVLVAAALLCCAHSPVLGAWTLAEALPLLLAVLAACFAVGGLLAVPALLRLTQRYRAPAVLIREALAGMRRGDYGQRLRLRVDDGLQDVARELDRLRDEVASREIALARLRHRLAASTGTEDAGAA